MGIKLFVLIVNSFLLGDDDELSDAVIGTSCDFMVMFISKSSCIVQCCGIECGTQWHAYYHSVC